MFSSITSMLFAALTLSAITAPIAGAPSAKLTARRTHDGKATWFDQNGNPGSCGWYSADTDLVVAVNSEQHSQSNCGRFIWVWKHGSVAAPIVVKIADTCPTCAPDQIDLSRGAFEALGASLEEGELDINWGGLVSRLGIGHIVVTIDPFPTYLSQW